MSATGDRGLQGPMRQRGLVRPRQGRWLAGVLAGLADRFGMSRNAMRAVFLISCLLPGPQFVAYLVLWLLMPAEQRG